MFYFSFVHFRVHLQLRLNLGKQSRVHPPHRQHQNDPVQLSHPLSKNNMKTEMKLKLKLS